MKLRGAPTVGAMRVLAVAANFVLVFVMARTMSLADFGLASALIAATTFCVVPALAGSDTAGVRFVAVYRGTEWSRDVLAVLYRRVGIASSAIAASLLLLVGAVSIWRPGGIVPSATVAILTIPVIAMTRVTEGTLRGGGSVVGAMLPVSCVLPLVATAIMLGYQSLAGGDIGAASAMTIRLAAAGLALAGALLQQRRLLRRLSDRVGLEPKPRAAEIKQVARGLFGVAVFTAFLAQSDVVAVSLFAGSRESGLYAAAARVALALNIALIAVNFILGPRVARAYHAADNDRVRILVHQAARSAFIVSITLAIPMAALAPQILGLFGSDFTSSATMLRVLILGYVISALAGPVGTVLNMTGLQADGAKIMAVAAVVDLALLLLLVPTFGGVGAAIAVAVAMATWNVLMVVVAWRRRRINATTFYDWTELRR